MIARLLGAAGAACALLAGAPWWLALPAAALFLPPGRLAPLAGLALTVAAPRLADASPLGDMAAFAAGALAALAVLHRVGGRLPWVALPWFGGLALVAALTWTYLPPPTFWTQSDVGARARLLALAALALVGCTLSYRPRYRNPAPEEGEAGAPGEAGETGGGGTMGAVAPMR